MTNRKSAGKIPEPRERELLLAELKRARRKFNPDAPLDELRAVAIAVENARIRRQAAAERRRAKFAQA